MEICSHWYLQTHQVSGLHETIRWWEFKGKQDRGQKNISQQAGCCLPSPHLLGYITPIFGLSALTPKRGVNLMIRTGQRVTVLACLRRGKTQVAFFLPAVSVAIRYLWMCDSHSVPLPEAALMWQHLRRHICLPVTTSRLGVFIFSKCQSLTDADVLCMTPRGNASLRPPCRWTETRVKLKRFNTIHAGSQAYRP